MKGQYSHDSNKNSNKCFMFLLSLCAILTVFCACFVIAIAFIRGHLENHGYTTRDYLRSAGAAALTLRRDCSVCMLLVLTRAFLFSVSFIYFCNVF